MKILLLGKGGQLGHALQAVLPGLGEVIAWDRTEVDLSRPEALREALSGRQVDVIVNAAAYTAVDRAEAEAATAHRVNAEAVKVLAEQAANTGALLVHYSTDYVFDGEKASAYVESDATNPQSEYGKSKRQGELAVLESGCRGLVFRTSWVFSAHGGNFVKTVLRLAAERDTLNVVADQYGAPTSASLLAQITAQAIPAALAGRLPLGLYHLSAGGHTSWHGLASFVVSRARANGLSVKLDAAHIHPIPTEAYPLPAKRPKNSRLDTDKLRAALGVVLPDWQQDVAQVVDKLTMTKAAT